MKYSTQIKPISYVKSHAAEIIRDLGDNGPPLVITQNGEAKAVIQSIADYEQNQETLALLKILALGEEEIERGEVFTLAEVRKHMRSLRTKRS